MPPFLCPHSLLLCAPTFLAPALLPVTRDKVSSRLTGGRSVRPFWTPVSPEIAAANGPAELG